MIKKLNKYLKKFERVSDRKLTPIEKYSTRLAWLGTGMMMTAPHLLPDISGIVLYVISGMLLIPQVVVAKQYNLVILNLNVVIAYGLRLI